MNRKRINVVAFAIIVIAFAAIAIASVQSWVAVRRAFGELNANYIPILDRVSEVTLGISQARTELFRFTNNYESSPFRVQHYLKEVQTNLLMIIRQQFPTRVCIS